MEGGREFDTGLGGHGLRRFGQHVNETMLPPTELAIFDRQCQENRLEVHVEAIHGLVCTTDDL